LWADWGDLSVLYHCPSGKTHFINASTAFLLEQGLDQPATVESAAQAVAEVRGVAADDELRADISDTLLRLEELGLIERA
jgi:PqqD family protein of HPr-rel-A system